MESLLSLLALSFGVGLAFGLGAFVAFMGLWRAFSERDRRARTKLAEIKKEATGK